MRFNKSKILFPALLFLFFISLSSPLSCFSMTLIPDVDYLGKITAEKSVLKWPGRLAVSPDRTLYVVDGYKNHIIRFNSEGNYSGDIYFPQVSAVGIAQDGTLYIGSHKDYSVTIYKNGKPEGYLGTGPGEFSSINDIAVDSENGNVYVVDNVANTVKVFNAAGENIKVIDGLNLPIAISVLGGNIYILDTPVKKDPLDKSTTSARISVFDGDGRLLKSFGNTGDGKDQMGRPTDIAVGANGSIYITDSLWNAILVYDTAGVYTGKIMSETGEIHTAVSLELSRDGRLYVSSSETRCIYMFALNGYPVTSDPQKENQSQPSDPVNREVIEVTISSGQKARDVSEVLSAGTDNIVATPDSGPDNKVRILDLQGITVKEFVPFDGYSGGLDTAVADVDGDGNNEIVAGSMDGFAKAGLFKSDGSEITSFLAFNNDSGIVVAADDLDRDGKSELIIGERDSGTVRAFAFSNGQVLDTGIYFSASEDKAVLSLASGDMDGDGIKEIITVTAQNGESSMKRWKLISALNYCDWSIAYSGELKVGASVTSLTVSDLDNDGVPEAILASEEGNIFIINGSGTIKNVINTPYRIVDISTVNTCGAKRNIIIGLDDGSARILSPEGVLTGAIEVFKSEAGLRVSPGVLGY